jgi:hypothetical protein
VSSIFDHLVHYWKLEESSGNTRLDSVGESHLLEVGGSVSNGAGKSGFAAQGAGVSTVYLSTLPAKVNLKSPSTLAFWVKYDVWPLGAEFALDSPTLEFNPFCEIDPGGTIFFATNYGGGVPIVSGALTLGVWNLVVLVVENFVWKMSVNGAAFTTGSAENPGEDTFEILGIGINEFGGLMDELGMWDVALTQDQVSQLWNSGNGLFPSTFPSLATEVEKRLKNPTAKIITLIEARAGINFQNWISDSTYCDNGAMKTPCGWEITDVRWGVDNLTAAGNPRIVENTPGSWHWDGSYLWVSPPLDPTTGVSRARLGTWFWWSQPKTVSIFSGTVVAIASFYFSNVPKTVGNRFYDPRLLSSPDLSQRIEARFGGIGQIGSGTISLANADGYFNSMQRWQWDAGSVILRLGVDLENAEMAADDYQTLATWGISEWNRTEINFVLKLIEPKNRLQTELPFAVYDRTTYPNIDDTWIGDSIPIAYGRLYGVEAVPINVGEKRFKVCGHAIREFSSVRLRISNEQKNSRVVPAVSWQLYSGTTYRYYLAGEEVRNVLFSSTSMTKKDSVADCVATAGSWATEENFAYVNPQGGQTISSGTYTIESALSVDSWKGSNFASVDAANGEFTLGADWGSGVDVSVDIIGKVDDSGLYISNGVDVIRDILATIGQANIDLDSFTAAKSKIKKGTDEGGADLFVMPVGVLIKDSTESADIISEILRAIRGFMFTDNLGRVSIDIFDPLPSDELEEINITDLLEFEEETGKLEATQINVHFNRRWREDWSELQSAGSQALQFTHNQTEPVVFDDDKNVITDSDDVESFAQRYLLLDAPPLRLYHVTIPWQAMLWKPGRQLVLNVPAFDLAVAVELIEIKTDIGAKRCRLVLGDQRGLFESAGFWVAYDATLPSRLSSLAGYGAGSLTWNDAWDPEIKTWAKQNVGYWTDENGFASPTDPESQMTSTWI